MPTYLIRISHSGNLTECNQIIKLFIESGSHSLLNGDWNCWIAYIKHDLRLISLNRNRLCKLFPTLASHRNYSRNNKGHLKAMYQNLPNTNDSGIIYRILKGLRQSQLH